jgi:hypothetical protein
MGRVMVIQDTRIRETFHYTGVDHVFRVNQWTSLTYAFTRICNYVRRHGRLDRLDVVCHGGEATRQFDGLNLSKRTSDPRAPHMSIHAGTAELQLCTEGITLTNVNRTRTIRGCARYIVVYACSAADTHPFLAGTRSDGRRLMAELSAHTEAIVYAADTTQVSEWLESGQVYDLGRWRGNLYEFRPDGSPPAVVESGPHASSCD